MHFTIANAIDKCAVELPHPAKIDSAQTSPAQRFKHPMHVLMKLFLAVLAAQTRSMQALPSASRLRILAFGDSLTEGWRNAFKGEEHYPYAKHLQVLLDKKLGAGVVQVRQQKNEPGNGNGSAAHHSLSQWNPNRSYIVE